MGKNKLKKFAEMKTFHNVFECGIHDISDDNPIAGLAGHWNENVFHNTNPIVLELGCGRGEYTVGLARLYPEKNFIGVDIKGARLWAGAKEAETENIANAAFLRTNIETITHFFKPNEVSEIWITFPDPQMKKATKRLTSTFFMARYQQFVQPNGLIHLKTDSPFLYTYTAEMLRLNGYKILVDTQDLYRPLTLKDRCAEGLQDASALQTHYEQQWLSRGMTIKYLRWELKQKDTFEEPTIEIEKDDYRSYGRNYQTKDTKTNK